MVKRIVFLLLIAPFLLWIGCARNSDTMLAEAGIPDSLAATVSEMGEDSDITYAPVSTSSFSDASTLIDASHLMSEDSASLLTDTLACPDDTLTALSLTRRFLRWLTTPRDSLLRATPERFALGDAFEVVGDSLVLRQWPFTDEVLLRKGDVVVVAEYTALPGDTVGTMGVKLAHDQETMGWVAEDDLRGRLLPDDSVSRFVYFFSQSHGVFFMVVLGLFGLAVVGRTVRNKRVQITWFHQVGTVYSTLFLWLLATTACLYALIQRFFPLVWEQFYYHPSLDPFDLAPLLSLFMLLVWGTVWVGLAVVDELSHRSRVKSAFFFGLALLSAGILLYVLFTFLPFYLGIPAWVSYTVLSVLRFRYHVRFRYTCGCCGSKMQGKGTCPVCGAENQ